MKISKTLTAILSTALLALLLSGPAHAGGGHYGGYNNHGYGKHHYNKHGYGKHAFGGNHRARHGGRHFRSGRHFNKGRHFGHRKHFGHSGRYHHGRRHLGYRAHHHGNQGKYLVGGLILGSLLHRAHSEPEPQVVYRTVIDRTPAAQPGERELRAGEYTRRLVSDAEGRCFELIRRADASETLNEVDTDLCSQ